MNLSDNKVDGTVVLHCDGYWPGDPSRGCDSTSFSIEFRKSFSTLEYERLGGVGHKPDTLIVVCTECKNEITITDTVGKIPPLYHEDMSSRWKDWDSPDW